WRRDEASRAVLAFFVLSLLMFSGRPTLGAVADLLPGADELYFPRFLIGVHLAGIFLAGIGAAWLGSRAIVGIRQLRSRVPARTLAPAAVVVFLAILTPAWSERADYAAVGNDFLKQQRAADARDGAAVAALIDKARGQGSCIYAGLSTAAGKNYRIGY